jgi:prepilin-type N-terminal cleavage/methylation domain-containing protein
MKPLLRHGFTLIEILVATAIGVALIASVWAGFRQAMNLIAKTKAKASLNSTARYLYVGLSEQASAIHPGGAMWLGVEDPSALPADPHEGRITLVFLAGVMNPDNFGQSPSNASGGQATDQAWVMWRWTRPKSYVHPVTGETVIRAGRLETALGPFKPLQDKIQVDWKPGTHNFNGRDVRSVSQPRRTFYQRSQLNGYFNVNAGKDRIHDIAALEDNSWYACNSTTLADAENEMGDKSRLIASLTLISDRVNNFAITIAQADGATKTADSTALAAANFFWDGVRFDAQPDVQETPTPSLTVGLDTEVTAAQVVDPSNKRPHTIRIRLGMKDPSSTSEVPFGLSFPLPSIRPIP